ncbi:MAG TPA: DUF2007 domain-containing protein [Clostridia bacterium]
MFCPKCKCEYREGFTRCSDCDVELVDQIIDETKDVSKNDEKPEFVDCVLVMTTYNAADILLIRSVLESSGITHFIQGETDMFMGYIGPARVMVEKDQAEEAMTILKDCSFTNTLFATGE